MNTLKVQVAIKPKENDGETQKFDTNDPNFQEYPITYFAGDSKLYYGLIRVLHMQMSQKKTNQSVVRKMKKLLIGRITATPVPVYARQGNATPQESTGYVHQMMKVNENVQGLERSCRTKSYLTAHEAYEVVQLICAKE